MLDMLHQDHQAIHMQTWRMTTTNIKFTFWRDCRLLAIEMLILCTSHRYLPGMTALNGHARTVFVELRLAELLVIYFIHLLNHSS